LLSIALIVLATWIALLVVVVALCKAAARSDECSEEQSRPTATGVPKGRPESPRKMTLVN
jgi:hypothetical protein